MTIIATHAPKAIFHLVATSLSLPSLDAFGLLVVFSTSSFRVDLVSSIAVVVTDSFKVVSVGGRVVE